MDASLAAKWIFPESYSQEALDLLAAQAKARSRIVAPPLLPIEVTTIVRQRMVRGGLPLPDARQRLNRFLSFPVTLAAPLALHDEALIVAATYGLPAVYDAHYLVLAKLLSCDLWTDDRRLLNTLTGKAPFVKWIGHYAPSATP